MFGFGKKKRDQERIEFLDLTMLSIRDMARGWFSDPDLQTTAFISGVLWGRKAVEEAAPVLIDEKRGVAKFLYDVSHFVELGANRAKDKENEVAHLGVAIGVQVVAMAVEAQTYRETEIARKLTSEIFDEVDVKVVNYPEGFLPIVTRMAERAINPNAGGT